MLRRTEAKRTRIECRRIRKQLIALRPKLIIGHAYLRARSNWKEIPIISSSTIKKNPKLRIEHRWRKGITDIYRKLQDQRDRHDLLKDSEPIEQISSLIPEEIVTPIDAVFEEPFVPPRKFDQIRQSISLKSEKKPFFYSSSTATIVNESL